MLKGIIFDLDGTLIDTLKDIGDSTNMMLEDYGFKTHDEAAYKIFVGNGFRMLVKRALPDGSSDDLVDEAYDKFVYYYDLHYMDETHPYEGIHDLLRELQKLNIKIGVNSNKRDDYTKALITTLFNDINFTSIVGQRENVPSKPNPYGANMIIEEMGLSKDEVIFVGDTKVDIETGKNASLKTIGVLWGFRDFDELKAAGADNIVSKPIDILDIIKA